MNLRILNEDTELSVQRNTKSGCEKAVKELRHLGPKGIHRLCRLL